MIEFPVTVGVLGWSFYAVFALAVVVIVWNLLTKEE